MLVVIFGATLLAFVLIDQAPGDPGRMIAYARYGEELTAEQIEQIRRAEGLDASLPMRYIRWLGHLVAGDMGCSLTTGESVSAEITARLRATLELALGSVGLALVIGIPFGIVAAVGRGRWPDTVGRITALLGISIPNFWLALLLVLLFALTLGWLPSFGYGSLAHLILPVVTLGTALAALTARITRTSMLEILAEDYIRTARAKGLSEYTVIFKHGLRNALIPVLTISGLQFGRLLEGAVIVESIFGWPGLGRLLVKSIFNRDYAMLQGCILLIAVLIVMVNFLVDISYAWLDPRIRYGSNR